MEPGEDGIQTLHQLGKPRPPLIVASKNENMDIAVQAMKIGAFKYMR
jgi:DNA-binding NtrC family response regulator